MREELHWTLLTVLSLACSWPRRRQLPCDHSATTLVQQANLF